MSIFLAIVLGLVVFWLLALAGQPGTAINVRSSALVALGVVGAGVAVALAVVVTL